jgi:hypothetical protein
MRRRSGGIEIVKSSCWTILVVRDLQPMAAVRKLSRHYPWLEERTTWHGVAARWQRGVALLLGAERRQLVVVRSAQRVVERCIVACVELVR